MSRTWVFLCLVVVSGTLAGCAEESGGGPEVIVDDRVPGQTSEDYQFEADVGDTIEVTIDHNGRGHTNFSVEHPTRGDEYERGKTNGRDSWSFEAPNSDRYALYVIVFSEESGSADVQLTKET